jgi:serine/threonine protein kinase
VKNLIQYKITFKEQIFLKTLKALSFIHDQGVAHGNLKTNNIMIGNKTQIKIINFAYSSVLTSHIQAFPKLKTSPYQAPEMLVEGKHDGKSE